MAAELPAAPTRGREAVLGRAAVAATAAVAVPVVAVAGIARGWPGVVGALAGVALVAVLFVAAAVMQSWASGRSVSTWAATVAAGFGVRLAVYALALSALGALDTVHRPSLAVATAVTFVLTLAVELRVLARRPQLFWLEPPAAARTQRS